ncbi:MAG TPA: MG2 domain-containing protein [Flavitalea sp.]|nr:MG2 domain-containing protein [Flavitalea sp.]
MRIDNMFARWVAESANSTRPVPEIDIFFNYDVNVATLKEKLTVVLNGQSVPFQFRTLSAAKKITVRLLNVQPVDKDLSTSIRIDKSLIAEGGKTPGKNDLSIDGSISSPYNLTINEITTDHDGMRANIYVRTNQQVVIDPGISSRITFNPAIKFTVAASDDGFVISSDGINPDKSYLLELKKGIRGNIGGILREDHTDQVAFGELEPALSFANSKAVYLSARGNELVELKITNIPKIRIIVSKIYESNLMAANRYGYYPVDKAPDEGEYYEEETNSDYVLGDVVYEKEIETSTLPLYGKSRLLKFNIEDRLPGIKGIYHVKVRSSTDYWVSDSRFISKTDIGLIAREGNTSMAVFANSVRTATGLDGVQLAVYAANNQLLGTGNSNKDGFAEIKFDRSQAAGFKPAMIIAKTPDDFTYLPLNSTGVNISRFEVGGKIANPSGLDAFVYEERDIYRPGETIHYAVVVRDNKWNTPGNLPVIFKFLFPNGKEFSLTRKLLNEQGAADGAIALPVSAITGTYTLEVYSGTMVLLGSHHYSVEEFVPDRLRLSTRVSTTRLKAGESMSISVHADNFFGPPAAGRKFESETQIRKVPFSPKGFDDYSFDLQATTISFDKKVTEGSTNETGDASVSLSAPGFYKYMGILEAKTYFTVFDETGRPVSKTVTTPIVTQDFFIGIGSDGFGYFPLNQPIRFPLVAVNVDGKVSKIPAKIQVVKHEYRTVLAKSGKYFRYESQPDDKIIAEQTINIDQKNTVFSFVPRTPGEYEIRASIHDGTSYVSHHFYSYGSWGDNNSFEVNTEGQVDIQADRDFYAVGDKARLLFKTPFNGQLLVTTEQDEIKSYHYLEVRNRSASMELTLNEEHLPNVYVTATLIKPHQLSEIPLTVAHGYKSIAVRKTDRKIPVEVTANKTSRSRTRQTISVKAVPGAFVTLAVVDNGVLQVTDFETPDPYKYFYSPRALGVRSYDVYPLLFPELRATLSSTGGDDETDMNKRSNPMPAQRVKIASYWSGLQQANGSGVAIFNVDVPAFSGELRMMAVAFKNASFGSAETTMKVADPLVISLGAPRFMSPGDTVDIQATLTNTTSKTLMSAASLQPTAPFTVIGSQSENISIEPGRESVVAYKLAAGNAIGTGKIIFNVKSGKEVFQESMEMSVRPAVPNQVRNGNGIINGSGQTNISIPVNGFIAQGSSYRLVIGRSAVADLGNQLKYLLHYPFGCTEQVVSSVFPQLYLEELSNSMQVRNTRSTNAAINEAIRIIKLRQIYNGGLTLWDDGSVNWWTSIYAAHFLIEARKSGYDIDSKLLSGLLEYINARLKTRETIDYYYNRNQQRKIAPKEVAYSLYVLNLAGRPNLPVMNYYKSNIKLLSLDSRYLLSASFALGGDRKAFQELVPASFSGEESNPETGGSFYSDIRDEAIALDVLLQVDPQNKQIPVMAKHVSEKLQSRQWFSTQEASFSLLALGKFAKQNAGATVTANINVNGKLVRKVTDKTISLDAKELGGNNITITSEGTGRLYYSWQAEGVAANGSYKEEDEFLKVRRRFFDRYGNAVTSNRFNQNDIIIVQVTVSKLFSGNIENIVATDILPAGFEIENPRTKEIPGMDWIQNASEPLSLDVRDDRINFFFDLNRSVQTYYYAVRAVTPGSFKLAPVSAEAMYNGEYHSYNGGGRVTILRK